MIKVLIVVSGLALFVPSSSPDPTGLTVLLLETQFTSTAEMPLHVPAVLQPIDSSSIRNWSLTRGDFKATFKLLAGGDGATIHLDAQKDFPQLMDLVADPQDAKINPDCLTGKCKDGNSHKRVAAIVNFQGGWRTRPVQRCDKEWVRPVDFKEGALSEFRKASALGVTVQGQVQRPLATGLALEAEIAKLEDLQIMIGATPSVAHLSSPEVCKQWRGDEATPCVVIEVENWPVIISASNCDKVNPSPECRVDRHFSMYYDLINKPPMGDRLLPYVVSSGLALNCNSSSGAGQPPGIRCPQAFALPLP